MTILLGDLANSGLPGGRGLEGAIFAGGAGVGGSAPALTMLTEPTATPSSAAVGDNVTLSLGTYQNADSVTGLLMQDGVDRTSEIVDEVWSPGVAGAFTWTVTASGNGQTIENAISGSITAPVVAKDVAYLYADKDTPYAGTASSVTGLSAQGAGGLAMALGGAGSTNQISHVDGNDGGFRFTSGRYLQVTGLAPNTSDGFILIVDATFETITGSSQGVNYGGNMLLTRSVGAYRAQAPYVSPAPLIGNAVIGKRVLLAMELDRIGQEVRHNVIDGGIVTVAATTAIPSLAPTTITIGQGMAGTIHRVAIINRPAGQQLPISLEDAVAQFGIPTSPPVGAAAVTIHDADGQSLALGPNIGALFAPDGRRWREILGSNGVQFATGLVRSDGVAVTGVATPLVKGYDLNSSVTGTTNANVNGNVPLGSVSAWALVESGFLDGTVIHQFHGAGGQPVYNFDNDPATGSADFIALYQNAEHWMSEVAAYYAQSDIPVIVPRRYWCQGEADISLTRGEYQARFLAVHRARCDLIKSVTGQADDPLLYIWQTGSYMRKLPHHMVVLDQLDIAREWNGVLIGPIYPYLVGDANVHPTDNASIEMGMLSAWATEEFEAGRGWNLLPPLSVSRSGGTITIPISIRSDETLMTEPGKYDGPYGGDPANLGLEVSGGGTITSASVSGGNIVVNVSGTVTSVRYAFQPAPADTRALLDTDGNGYGPHRGIIRTTLTKAASIGGLNMTLKRWAPSFEVAIA